jgi:hypothetical protein
MNNNDGNEEAEEVLETDFEWENMSNYGGQR